MLQVLLPKGKDEKGNFIYNVVEMDMNNFQKYLQSQGYSQDSIQQYSEVAYKKYYENKATNVSQIQARKPNIYNNQLTQQQINQQRYNQYQEYLRKQQIKQQNNFVQQAPIQNNEEIKREEQPEDIPKERIKPQKKEAPSNKVRGAKRIYKKEEEKEKKKIKEKVKETPKRRIENVFYVPNFSKVNVVEEIPELEPDGYFGDEIKTIIPESIRDIKPKIKKKKTLKKREEKTKRFLDKEQVLKRRINSKVD